MLAGPRIMGLPHHSPPFDGSPKDYFFVWLGEAATLFVVVDILKRMFVRASTFFTAIYVIGIICLGLHMIFFP